jgi:hypothetical protein
VKKDGRSDTANAAASINFSRMIPHWTTWFPSACSLQEN